MTSQATPASRALRAATINPSEDGASAVVPGVEGPIVMGIVNVTPDSFSDGGSFLDADRAVAHGLRLIAEGATVVDVGGESTRPGAAPVSAEVQLARVIGVVGQLSEHAVVSIDTRSEVVARAAVIAGATILNDVGASLGHVAADLGVGWIAMHAPADPSVMDRHTGYVDVVNEVTSSLVEAASAAKDAGAARVWIDPGIGFGKDLDGNLDLLAHLDHLVATGWPVAIGTSRKSGLGVLSGRADRLDDAAATDPPPGDRLEASLATVVWAAAAGVELIRVHDIAPTVQALSAAREFSTSISDEALVSHNICKEC